VALFAATVLPAFGAFGDRSPAWVTPIYVAIAFVVVIFVRRLVGRIRAKRDS